MVRVKRSETIVEDYLAKIARGEMKEGDRLPTESEIGELYGVSRSAVREAVHTLAAKGLIVARQGSGTTVAPRDQWNTLDPAFIAHTVGEGMFKYLLEAREIIEPAIARMAAQRALPEDIERMERHLAEQAEFADDAVRNAIADIAWHDALAHASHNPVLVTMHGSIAQLGRVWRTAAADVPGAVGRALEWHTRVLDCVKEGDAEAAQAAMRLHLHQVGSELSPTEELLARMERRGE